MPRNHRRRPAAAVAVFALATATGLSLAAGPVAADPTGATSSPGTVVAAQGEARGHYDARPPAAGAPTVAGPEGVAARSTLSAFGARVTVDVDARTGTPRMVARLDGHLTGQSSQQPQDVVLDYVRARLSGFGLQQDDLASLRLSRTYTDVAGIRHLSWTQEFDGLEVFGHGLQAAVTSTGRLLTVGGSPMPGALVEQARGGRLSSAAEAIAAAREDLGETTTEGGPKDRAQRMLFVAGGRTYRAWRTITMSAANPALSVLDAKSGGLLYRRPLASHERRREPAARLGGSIGVAHKFFPGSARGGVQRSVNFTDRGWLSETATSLSGNNTHTWSDVNDDDLPQSTEEVRPQEGQTWNFALRPFDLAWASFCGNPYPCSWNPNKPYSWRANRKQNATQAFYFVNNFHDHLLAAPIGFTEAAGNFQLVNSTGQGLGDDHVEVHTIDGADSGNGLPDGLHVDNADMATPPDGLSPTMQLHLQHQPGTTYPAGDPYSPTNVGDEADRVYHEYTHGLANRLVVDAHGASTLGGVQAGAMDEGWGDWYAMDYLVAERLQKDEPDLADVSLFVYDGAGAGLNRTEPLDCKKRSTSPKCDGGATGDRGGYTYADYGHVVGIPEVHGDGEIWSQTLWDLRDAVGSAAARSLVTRAMELAPHNPSFLDMRNALLLADTAVFAGSHRATVWKVFARRGMGFFAGSLGGDDASPAPDGHLPPKKDERGLLTGTVRDSDTGQPVAGVPVTLAFQGASGAVNPTTVTAADGRLQLGPVPAGTYRKLVVAGAGYDPVVTRVTVASTGTVADVDARRNWAAASGGARVSAFTGPDHSPQCGPVGAIDGSLTTGWGSTTGDDEGTPTDVFVPKLLTVDLGRAVDVSELAVDPAATCGDGGSASTAGYRIETSPDGATWTVAAEGTFTAADRGRLNPVAPAAGTTDVRYVRFTMLSNQTPDFARNCPNGAYSGCSWTDLTELAVYGAAG